MIKFYTLLTLMFLSANMVFAQADTTKKSSDKINVFDRSNKSGAPNLSDISKKGPEKKLNAFKINPFMLLNGEVPVYFEHELGNEFAVQVGAGITFKDYIANLLDSTNGVLAPPKGLENATAWKTGVCLDANIRYYFDDVMDGLYIAADLGYRSNGLQFSETTYNVYGLPTSTGPTTYYSGSYHNVDLKVLVGGEYSLFDSDHIIMEWYLGVGVRNYSVNYFDDINGVPAQTSTLRPRVYLGYTLGYKIEHY